MEAAETAFHVGVTHEAGYKKELILTDSCWNARFDSVKLHSHPDTKCSFDFYGYFSFSLVVLRLQFIFFSCEIFCIFVIAARTFMHFEQCVYLSFYFSFYHYLWFLEFFLVDSCHFCVLLCLVSSLRFCFRYYSIPVLLFESFCLLYLAFSFISYVIVLINFSSVLLPSCLHFPWLPQ